ncbi:MAG: coproporphyrinogen-III oxidase family protein [Opitutales bacterium]
MTVEALEGLLAQDENETQAGNYFISNYPPFSFWKPEESTHLETVLDQPPAAEAPVLGLYYHIPFCRKRCRFCYFKVYTDKNAKEIGRYLEATFHEAEQYAVRPYLQGRMPKFVYFGGGTPSYLSPAQLERVFGALREAFDWSAVEEVAFEAEPGTLNEKKVQALRALGVTRLSLGIENFDDAILENNGRAHRSPEVFKALDWVQAAGFDSVNIDLIAGMVGETEENWQRCVEKTLEIAPESVTIYQMEVPFNTTIYKEMQSSGSAAAPVADWKTKRRWVAEAFARLEEAGYHIGSAYTAVKDPETTQFLYRDELWTGADLLGMGVASFGHLGGVHYQNVSEFGQYCDALEGGESAVSRALLTTPEERLMREMLLQFKLGYLEPPYFQEKFGADILERFGDGFSVLENRGLAKISEARIQLNREGLLRIDNLLHAFFLQQHTGARYT